MKLSTAFCAAVLALAAFAASCTMARHSPGDGSVYLVGVEGGG
jgi:hypothetical protein